MLSVVIPTLDAGRDLPATLAALVPGAVSGLIREVIVADGSSCDPTVRIAEAAGATVIRAPRGRGTQLAAGAAAARGDWLLFLHADTVLEPGWETEVAGFIDQASAIGYEGPAAACFRLRLADASLGARIIERGVALRTAWLGLPYGDQGLVISRQCYDRLGGFAPLPLMEDVDLVRRLGRRVAMLRHAAVTDAGRYRRDGYLLRPLRNWTCLTLYFLKVPPHVLLRLYG